MEFRCPSCNFAGFQMVPGVQMAECLSCGTTFKIPIGPAIESEPQRSADSAKNPPRSGSLRERNSQQSR
jgi:hypothetical protein